MTVSTEVASTLTPPLVATRSFAPISADGPPVASAIATPTPAATSPNDPPRAIAVSERSEVAATVTDAAWVIVTLLARFAASVLLSWMSTTWAPTATIPAVPAKAVPFAVSPTRPATTFTAPPADTRDWDWMSACVPPWIVAIAIEPPTATTPAATPPTIEV